jgi:hypothetical protein
MSIHDHHNALLSSLKSVKCIISTGTGSIKALPPTPPLDTVDITLPDQLSLEQRLVDDHCTANYSLGTPSHSNHSVDSESAISLPLGIISESKVLFEHASDQQLYLDRLSRMVEMGFGVEEASRALLECRLEEGEAVERLLGLSEE